MPDNMIKAYAKQTNKSTLEIEKLWSQAKQLTTEFFGKKESEFNDKEFKYSIGILKNMLGIKESLTLDFLNSDLKMSEFIDEVMVSAPFSAKIPTLRPKDDKETEEDESEIEVVQLGYN